MPHSGNPTRFTPRLHPLAASHHMPNALANCNGEPLLPGDIFIQGLFVEKASVKNGRDGECVGELGSALKPDRSAYANMSKRTVIMR